MTTRILHGDCRNILPTLGEGSFECIVTSPPYWGLRDYGVDGQIGLEPTLTSYLETMVGVCRELRRILTPDGTFWLNIGDCYATDAKWGGSTSGKHVSALHGLGGGGRSKTVSGLKPKDLCMVPNRLAILLQDDGWYVRSEIIWHKPNPMPESVEDRPTSSHEKVWLLTKSERYFYSAAAIREADCGRPSGNGFVRNERLTYAGRGNSEQWKPGGGRNARNVWSIAAQPFKGSHFATMPPDLVERCILAGCPFGGQVLDPFGGSGTTALVADRLGHDATLIELNPAYLRLQRDRIESDGPLFAEISEGRI